MNTEFTLLYHPLSSFCWKALIGLYEVGVPFTKRQVDLGDPEQRAAFARVWPFAKFPVLVDEASGRAIPESTTLLEHADRVAPGGPRLVPRDPERAIECRHRDRLVDWYVHVPMQAIVGDRLRPEGSRDPLGVERARATLETAYDVLEPMIGAGPWMLGDAFTLADCAAMPALFYADKVQPLGARFPQLAAYLARVKTRPSVARVLDEAAPYFHMFPG